MKRVLSRITAAIILAGALGACAPDADSDQQNGAIQVLTPMSDANGQYALEFFELKELSDIRTVAGKYVQFFMSPRVVDGELRGTSPQARFIRNGAGQYIPGNEMTQQLVTVYAHMQRLALLDQEVGAEGVNTWPRKVGVAIRVKEGSQNNAYYDGESDSMFLVPYNQAGLPIPINGGIIAHEHFHSLFYKLSMADSPVQSNVHDREEFFGMAGIEESGRRQRRFFPSLVGAEEMEESELRRYYNLVMTRSLNEGLADFWGWMYTGNPDFIAQSLPREGAVRSLKVSEKVTAFALPSPEQIQRSLQLFNIGRSKSLKEYAIGYSYSLAPRFSQVMKRLTDIYAKENNVEHLQARKDIAKVLIKVLPLMKKDLQKTTGEAFSSANFILLVAQQMPKISEPECQFLAQVLNHSGDVANTKYVCSKESEWKLKEEQLVVPAPAEQKPSEEKKQ